MNEHWQAALRALPPGEIQTPSGPTEVAVRLDADGRVLRLDLVSSSGVPALDQAVLSAWRDSEPVPPPDGLLTDGVAELPTLSFEVLLHPPDPAP